MQDEPDLPWWPRAVELWLAGSDYTVIGRLVGVSRERVRQLAEYLPPREWVEKTECSDIVSKETLRRWIGDGRIKCSTSGLVLRTEVEDRVVALMTRQCQYPKCTEPVDDLHERTRFCKTHIREVRRYRYPAMTPEERVRQAASLARWKRNNRARQQETDAG